MIKRDDFEDLTDKVVILDNFTGRDSLDRKIELLCFALEEHHICEPDWHPTVY